MTLFTTPDGKIIKVEPFGFILKISNQDWSNMPASAKAAVLHLFNNYDKSPNLAAALQHLHNEGVKTISLHFGPNRYDAYGSQTTWGSSGGNRPEPR